jgi:hypothetical protein
VSRTKAIIPVPSGFAPRDEVHTFLEMLLARYARWIEHGPSVRRIPPTLELAEAATRYAAQKNEHWPVQVAVLGPTQTGKSTVVNILAGATVASVSPLAGHTIHAHGFWPCHTPLDVAWPEQVFPGYERWQDDELPRDRHDLYTLTLSTAGVAFAPNVVIWDTPDFDSLAAAGYMRSVREAAALADVYVVVLSKEKYSDLAAWEMLRLLEPLNRPIVLCVNKLREDAREVVLRSLRERLAEFAPGVGDVPIVALPYAALGGDGQPRLDTQSTVALLAAARQAVQNVDRRVQQRGVVELIRRHWDTWLQPVRQAAAVVAEWDTLVVQALSGMCESYQRDYLDHPRRFDSFRRATAELLTLLEIPGVGASLAKARYWVSWPVRTLFESGRELLVGKKSDKAHLPTEQAVLLEGIESLLVSLQRDLARRSATGGDARGIWAAIAEALEAGLAESRSRFAEAAGRHHDVVQKEIHAAAGELYEMLQKKPAVLNTLRTARVTIDAASVAFAIKAGGAHLNDLIFAPAMVGLTSMMTESALGGYFNRVSARLKQRQMDHLENELVQGVFAQTLQSVARQLDDPGVFSIPDEEIAAAAGLLEQWGRRADG